MAGKRQHYVPRLLQRGFLSNPSDKAERTWLHRPGTKARLVSIRDIGIADWFYSKRSSDGTPTLDDLITDLERDLSGAINALRASSPGSPVSATEAARIISHLVFRTAHLREVMSAGMASMISELRSIFTDISRLRNMMGIEKPTPAPIVLDTIHDSVAGIFPSHIPAELSERILCFLLRELGDGIVNQMVEKSSLLLPQLFNALDNKIANAHNLAVPIAFDSNSWTSILSTFQWSVEAGVELILPDAVALAVNGKGQLSPLLFTTATDVRIVLMPLAADRILVGRAKGSGAVDLSSFNRDAATYCQAFFIGARPFDDEELNKLIGTATRVKVEQTFNEAVRAVEQSQNNVEGASPLLTANETKSRDLSCTLQLVDFGDAALTLRFADVLRRAISVLAQDFPLHGLDGFTIAINYPAALANIDRGDPNLPPVTSNALGYSRGVAQTVTVLRNGGRKEHLIIAADLAQTWLSSDPEVYAAGFYTLVKMLAQIEHSTRYGSGETTQFAHTIMSAEFHVLVAYTPSSYWSAYQAAYIHPDQGQIHADLVIDSLEFATRTVLEERARISEDSSIQATILRARECVSAVLSHAAN